MTPRLERRENGWTRPSTQSHGPTSGARVNRPPLGYGQANSASSTAPQLQVAVAAPLSPAGWLNLARLTGGRAAELTLRTSERIPRDRHVAVICGVAKQRLHRREIEAVGAVAGLLVVHPNEPSVGDVPEANCRVQTHCAHD